MNSDPTEEELERQLMAHSPRLQAILDAARQRIAAGEGIPEEEFWEQVASDQAGRKRSRKQGKTA